MNNRSIFTTFLVIVLVGGIGIGGLSTTVSAGQYSFDSPTVSTYINGDNTIESGETKTFDVRVMNQGDTVLQNDSTLRDLQDSYSVYDVKPGEIE